MSFRFIPRGIPSRLYRLVQLACMLVVGLPAFGASAPARPEPPPFQEIFDLVRTNAAGVTDSELNRAAVEGLILRLRNRARLVDANQTADMDSNTTAIAATAVFDDSYGYIRIARVGKELPTDFAKAMKDLTATNKLRGLALDLRFATGRDFKAAAAVADLFLASEQKLFEWSGGTERSTAKTNAFRAPVAVLVNHGTTGAAEALAAVLRDTEVGLLIGTNTAGLASTTRDFTLSNGQVLRVATVPLKLAGGANVASITPDIFVEVAPDAERAYFVDAYALLPRPGFESNAIASLTITNRNPRRPRINEAELVRMSREGIDPEEEARAARAAASPTRPVVTDPALARAIDLLKALAVVRQTRF